MALDALLPRYHDAGVCILHTDSERSGIADAYTELMHVLKLDYDGLKILGTALTYANGSPLNEMSSIACVSKANSI